MKLTSRIMGENPEWPGTRDLSRSCAPADQQVQLQDGRAPLTSQTDVFPGPNKAGNITKQWKDKLSPFIQP